MVIRQWDPLGVGLIIVAIMGAVTEKGYNTKDVQVVCWQEQR